MTNLNDTTKLHALRDSRATARDILQHVYRALQAKGYDPITQLTGLFSSIMVSATFKKRCASMRSMCFCSSARAALVLLVDLSLS